MREEEIFSQGKRRRSARRREKNLGVILSLLFSLSDRLERAYKSSLIGYFFISLYSRLNEGWERGAIRRRLHRRRSASKGHGHRSSLSFAELYESSLLSRIITGFTGRVVNSRVRVMGVFLFVFGFLTTFTAMLRYFLVSEIMWINLITGVAVALLSVPLLISGKRFGQALIDGRISGYVMNVILGVDESRFEWDEDAQSVGYPAVLAVSAVLGIITYVISPVYIIGAFIFAAIFGTIMCFPELGIMATLVCIPFTSVFDHPSIAVMVLIGITLASYISKLVRGKRVLRLTLIDVLVALLGLLILFGGICTGGSQDSFKTAAMYFAFLLLYFLIVNSYIRKTWIYRGLKLIVISTGIVAILGVLEDGMIGSSFVDMSIFSDIGARISAFLGNPNMLAAYLVIVLPIALGEVAVAGRWSTRLWYIFCSVAICVCIVMTWSRSAWLGMAVALVAFMLACDFRTGWLVVGAAATVPIWIGFVPDSLIRRLSSILAVSESDLSYRMNIWRGVTRMIGDHLISGVGVGEEAFKNAYVLYAVSGTEAAVHSHNLYLQVLLELGIVGIVILALIVVMFAQRCSSEISDLKRGSKTRIMISAGFSGISGVLIMGLTDYVWYDYRVFLIFWAVMALTVALARINEKERKKELAGISNGARSVELEIS